MDLEIFILGGYGQFVWPAFIFTFVSCFILYKKTKKELLKQEKLFLKEYEQLSPVKIKTVEEKKITKEALSGSSI
tara:strand:- start:242 stop:466 length:225 start_codon:yes stop_codon:yes gene_type:complete